MFKVKILVLVKILVFDNLLERLTEEWAGAEQYAIKLTIKLFRKRVKSFVSAEGKTFKY